MARSASIAGGGPELGGKFRIGAVVAAGAVTVGVCDVSCAASLSRSQASHISMHASRIHRRDFALASVIAPDILVVFTVIAPASLPAWLSASLRARCAAWDAPARLRRCSGHTKSAWGQRKRTCLLCPAWA